MAGAGHRDELTTGGALAGPTKENLMSTDPTEYALLGLTTVNPGTTDDQNLQLEIDSDYDCIALTSSPTSGRLDRAL